MAKAGRKTGLSSLLRTLERVCKAIDVFAPLVRRLVPAGNLAAYDAAVASIGAACAVIRQIDYIDQEAGTNPPVQPPA